MTPFFLSIWLFVASSFHPTENQAGDEPAIYSVVLTDVVRSLALEIGVADRGVALDPYARSLQELQGWSRGDSTNRLSAGVLAALRPSLGQLLICEPIEGQACRGSTRGRVVRVSTITRSHPDSAKVVVQVTYARAERDYSVIVSRPLYYSYELIHSADGWRIGRAERASFDPRTA
jgi:hypothetical protein